MGSICKMMVETAPMRPTGYVDPGWDHGTAQDEKKKKVKCNYCGKVVSGGIYRLKQHLARVSGEVTYCESAPEDVYLKMRENLEGFRSNKKLKLSETDESAYLSFQSHDDRNDDMEHTSYRKKGKKVMGDKSMILNLTPLRSLGYVDPGWEYGVAEDERKKKVKCNYCGKIVSGGINRFKQHLARIPGEVAPCKNAPDDVYVKIKENMKWHRSGRRQRKDNGKEISSFSMYSEDEPGDDELEEEATYHYSKDRLVVGERRLCKDLRGGFSSMSPGSSELYLKKSRLNSNTLKTTKTQMPVSYKLSNSGANKKNRKEVISAICEFFYYAGIPMHTVNSLSFQKMLDLVGQYGQGLAGPSSRSISGRFLRDELSTITDYLVEYRTCWEVTGCSIMADSWKNVQGRTLISLMVSCPRGVYFLSLVDATDIVDDPPNLFKLLDKVVDEIGEENVIQVVTQDTPSYKGAGKMIEDKRKNIFWTPCATHCIDRVLENFTKIRLVSECIEKAQKVTKFIYNRIWLLNLMKKEFTGGQDILRPSLTKHAAGFRTLQGILDHRNGLKRMFLSNKWILCRFSKSDEGKEVEQIILNSTFWKKMQYVQKSVDPVLQTLQKVYSDGNLSMPYIYNEMHKAKLAIKSSHAEDARKYGPFLSVIDIHWNSLASHPLCLAAYYLNPEFRYRSDYVANPEVVRGLNECIVRLEPDSRRRVSASMQISDFVSAKADFGTELAISTRTELDPAIWWQQHGINCLELRRIAVRILSQTCSSFGCEHNWSIHDQIHCQSQNHLAEKKLNDLLYAHYNLRLRERQITQSQDLISLDTVLLEGLLDNWVVDAGKLDMPDDEDVLDNEDGYDYDILDYEDTNSDIRRGSLEMVTLSEVDPLEIHPCTGPARDDDADLDFFDDDLSD